VTITKPLPSTKRFSIRIKTIRHKSAVSYYLNKGDKIYTDEIVKKCRLPCFVKPNKAGSSFGISKVKTEAELPIAIEAYMEDNEIIIASLTVLKFRWA
jgi:D-alanine-D-alanine ligase-like ATP-grasp enzyme